MERKPIRVQRRRVKGEPGMPPGAIYVGRPSKWGNPFVVHVHSPRCAPDLARCPLWIADDRADATRKFRHTLLYPVIHQPNVPDVDEVRYELRGRDLACWCPPSQPCHADVLLEIANG